MLKICNLGLIEDRVWSLTEQNGDVITISTVFNVFGTSTYATMKVDIDKWEVAVEDFVFSNYYQKRKK
jgi:hypothetical protein